MFGDNLKQARTNRKLSQAGLARMLMVSQQTVGSWEVNRTSPPPETIAQIAKVLGVSTNYLLGSATDAATGQSRVLRIPVLGYQRKAPLLNCPKKPSGQTKRGYRDF